MNIDELLTLAEHDAEFTVPLTWTQGRTLYGGITAALIVAAMTKQVNAEQVLRSVHTNFSAPSLAGKPITLKTQLLRQGKTISQWTGQIVQDGTVCVHVSAVFGKAAESALTVDKFKAPDMPPADEGLIFPKSFGDNAGFVQHMDVSLTVGDIPMAGTSKTELGGWMRYYEPPKAISPAHLIGLIDVWPPATLPMLKSMRAGSTVSWSLQMVQPLPVIKPDSFLGYLVNVEQSSNGYGISNGHVWNQRGELLALTQQTFIVYE